MTRLPSGLFAIALAMSVATAAPVGNLSPSEALNAFETEPGFRVELVAAEPLTIDPVAVAFDERGRLFVAENRDYPTGSPDGRPLGLIALLEDTNADGRMDRRIEFASGISFPNGVMPWRGGVIVTAAPDVWWFADPDGDGRAEVKELLLTGFDTGSTSQLRANDPTLGPDGWVYIAGGLRGGKVHSLKKPDVVLDLSRGDLRFRPDTGEIELTEGKSQFGLAFDDAGNRFACMNRVQSQHAPLPALYLARNPFLTPPGVLHDCPEITDNTLMTRYTAGAARYYPISANITTADSHLGTYSAACAVHIYRGRSLPREYWGAAFSCDPTGNLVRGDRLAKTGGTFAARRIREGTEALRTRDNWFRPVFLADGPDGSLYIADMYRKVIEHPEYLPGDVRKHMDFAAGNQQGRIWRLTGPSRSAPKLPDYANANLDLLVEELSSEIPWRRDTAFRLLVERGDERSVPLLKKAFKADTGEGAAVLQLHLLREFNALDESILKLALQHKQPGVRQNALRMSEPLFPSSEDLRKLALAAAGDSDPHVRFQAALSLGVLGASESIRPLARIARVQADDRWTRAAIQTALTNEQGYFNLLVELAKIEPLSDGLLELSEAVGRQIGSRARSRSGAHHGQQLQQAVSNAPTEFRIAAFIGFADAAPAAFAAKALDEIFKIARHISAAQDHSHTRRIQAIRLLGLSDSAENRAVLSARLDSREPAEIQTTAARALLKQADAKSAGDLLEAELWNSYTPALRMVILNTMAGQPEFASALLSAIEQGHVPPGMLTPSQRDRLRKSKEEAIRKRAEKLFSTPDGDRQQVFEQSKAALQLQPSPAAGHALFQTHCSACHRLNQEGVAVGPDLFDIRNQSKEAILYHIVVPEAEIAPNFVNYECETKDGRMLSGLLASESSAAITLRMAQGVEETIARSEIARLTASRVSLMPQEFEKTMTHQEMANLLAYLRGEQ